MADMYLKDITNQPDYRPVMAKLKYAAFKSNNLFTQIVFADCKTQDVEDWFVRREEKDQKDDKDGRWRVIGCFVRKHPEGEAGDGKEDEDDLVAYGKWLIPKKKSSSTSTASTAVVGVGGEVVNGEGEVTKESEKKEGEDEFGLPELPPGTNLEVHRRYRQSLQEHAHGGVDEENEWYLVSISTSPAFEGRGAGSMLLAWGQEQAQKEGKGIFLASAPAAEKFYANRGFKEVLRDRVYFDENGDKGRWEEGVMMRWKP